jgi:hypothetical protein
MESSTCGQTHCGEYYDEAGNFVGEPEPTCEEAATPWLDEDCPCRADYPDEKWCKDACARCAAREELWSLGTIVRGEWATLTTLRGERLDGIYLGEEDFLFTVTVTPGGGEQGTILARHAAGVAKGWSLYIDAADHIVLTIYGDGGHATLKSGTPLKSLTPGVEQVVVTLERTLKEGDLHAVAKLRFDGADPPQINHIFNDGWNWNDKPGVVSPDKLNLGALSTGELTFTGTLKNAKLEGGKKAGRACCTGENDLYTKCSSTDMKGTSCTSQDASMGGFSCVNDCSQEQEIGSASYWACQCRPE